MPLYEFQCEVCGPFQEWRSLSEYSKPAYCPHCQAGARRVFTPPNLYRTSPTHRKMRYLEEKSAHEPEVVVRRPPGPEEGAPARPKPIVSPHPWAIRHGCSGSPFHH
jgi:putative FmdB family regulatory protein